MHMLNGCMHGLSKIPCKINSFMRSFYLEEPVVEG